MKPNLVAGLSSMLISILNGFNACHLYCLVLLSCWATVLFAWGGGYLDISDYIV